MEKKIFFHYQKITGQCWGLICESCFDVYDTNYSYDRIQWKTKPMGFISRVNKFLDLLSFISQRSDSVTFFSNSCQCGFIAEEKKTWK